MEKKLVISITYLSCVTYLFMYINIEISSMISLLILILSFIKVIFGKKYDIETYLVIMLFNHVLVPSIAIINNSLWNVSNTLLKFGLFLIIIIKMMKNNQLIIHRKLKFTYIYSLLMLIWSIYDFSISTSTLMKRFVPFAFLIIFLFFKHINDEILDIKLIYKVLRIIIVFSLIAYIMPNYVETTRNLIESGIIANQPVFNIQYILFGKLPRNMGIAFDARILGITSYLFLFIIIKYNFGSKLDFPLAILVSLSCFSRGATVVMLMILLGHLYYIIKGSKYRLSLIIFSTCIIVLISAIFLVSERYSKLYNSDQVTYLSSFNIFSERNVFTQRKVLRDMAIEEYKKKPILGNGLGWVTSKTAKAFINENFSAATDAYFNGLLAEVGIIGLIVFLMSYVEIFNIKKSINIFLFIGFMLHLTGTNIPDSGSDYVYILFIIFSSCVINDRNLLRTTKINVLKENKKGV